MRHNPHRTSAQHEQALPDPRTRQGWPRASIPIPPIQPLLHRHGLADKTGTLTASGLAVYITTGTVERQSLWAVVVIAIVLIAGETIQRFAARQQRA
ncbi:hypothetical protein [Streptomyces sp. NEAU-174]|uniref:hypothetical protein n=1 Tax=Streptomyces sp. NEAU-174 TaxID=3458254 RepID=UPI00404519EC